MLAQKESPHRAILRWRWGKKITLPDFKLLFSIQMCTNSSQSKLTKTDVRTTSLPSSSVASPSLTDCCFANSTPQPLQRVSALYLFRSSPYFTAPFLPSSCDPQELKVGQGAATHRCFNHATIRLPAAPVAEWARPLGESNKEQIKETK